MLMCIVHLLVLAIGIAVLYWVVTAILEAFQMTGPPAPIMKLIGILVVMLLLAYAANCLFGSGPSGWPSLKW
jgi:hypothetical protein